MIVRLVSVMSIVIPDRALQLRHAGSGGSVTGAPAESQASSHEINESNWHGKLTQRATNDPWRRPKGSRVGEGLRYKVDLWTRKRAEVITQVTAGNVNSPPM